MFLTGVVIAPAAHAEARQHPHQTDIKGALPGDAMARTAAALGAELGALRRRSISIAAAMQQHEEALSLLESRLASLATDETRIEADLKLHVKDRRALLMALVALARHRPNALAFTAHDPVALDRSALVIGRTVPALDRAARRLSHDLTRLAALRQGIAAAEHHHRKVQKSLDVQRFQLDAVMLRRSRLRHRRKPGDRTGEQQALRQLATEATSLKGLLNRLDAAEKTAPMATAVTGTTPAASRIIPAKPAASAAAAPEEVAAPATAVPHLRPFAAARGSILVPASGRLVEHFGKAGKYGIAAKGLTYVTRPGAQVVAPYDGKILFAGPFHGYGQILIIAHSDGYDSLLAGLARVDVAIGQWLVAGEPVGTMPKNEMKPRLYLELRHGGRPINPLPWLATPNEKVRG